MMCDIQVQAIGRGDVVSAGQCRPCADCGVTVTLELGPIPYGFYRAPFYAPCPVTDAIGHRVTP